MIKVAVSGFTDVYRWLVLPKRTCDVSRVRRYTRKVADLVQDHTPGRAPLTRRLEGVEHPLLLLGSRDRPRAVHLDGETPDIGSIVVDVGDIPIVFPGVESDDIQQISETEITPDTQLVSQIHLTDGDPLVVRPLCMGFTVGEAGRVSRVRTPTRR
jgi:hypothetical protein